MKNSNILYDTNLINDIFAISAPKEFKTLQDQLTYVLTDEGYKKEAGSLSNDELTSDKLIQSLDPGIKELLGLDGESPIPTINLSQGKYRDTSLGGNDALNCYPQAHEDDDIVPELNKLDDSGDTGLGRVYEEKIDRNQQILWLTFGVPQFTDLTTFYTTAINDELAHVMNTGENFSAWNAGHLFGSIVGFVATLPIQPFIFMAKLVKGLYKYKATKYFEFKPTMPLFYRIVNTQIAQLIPNMMLSRTEQDYEEIAPGLENFENGGESKLFDNNFNDVNSMTPLGGQQLSSDMSDSSTAGLPDLFSTYGLDILRILQKRDVYDKKKKVTDIKSLQDYLQELKDYKDDEKSFMQKVISGFQLGSSEALAFVGFRVEKSTDSSESLTNSVALPSIASTVNSQSQEARDRFNSAASFNLAGSKSMIQGAINAISGFMSGIISSVNMSGIFGILKGQGLIDYQELWKDSSFNKSYSFKVALRAVSGDRVSLAYRYIIFLVLLSAALPRAVGRNAYTSPFLVRGYLPGKIAIPIGIIDSLNITRGSSEFGWSVDGLPLSIDVTFTIKDLTPNMFLGLADSKNFMSIIGQESSLSEFLMTLAGLSIKDRLLLSSNIKRRAKILMTLSRTTKLNPILTGFRLSNNTFIGNAAMALNPVSSLPDKKSSYNTYPK